MKTQNKKTTPPQVKKTTPPQIKKAAAPNNKKAAPAENKKAAPPQVKSTAPVENNKKTAPLQDKKNANKNAAPNNNQKSNPTRNRNVNTDKLSVSKIKKRIRDVKRTMNQKKEISAEALITSKRRLRALEFELGEKLIDEKERANATKYHKVKHFERKKAERIARRAKKTLSEADEKDKAKAQEALDQAELLVKYITHYPKTLPYVSIYPKQNSKAEKSVARKERLLKEIKQALLDGDKDLSALHKKYRNDYKQKLIKRGDIAPEAPVDDVEMKEQEDKEQDNDDFFESESESESE